MAEQHDILAGRYRLDSVLGEGGMGRVWLAYDLLIHRHVAVKHLTGVRPTPDLIERAMREARSAGSLHHPNAVAVYDLLVLDGLPYVVMEYVDGTSLAQRLERGRIDPFEMSSIASQLAAALTAAHDIGIVHRDVKPGNILLSRNGTAKLADFGIARTETQVTMTGTGVFVGTVSYMAPEIALGQPSSPASDMWSFGATLFDATEGRAVFEGTSAVAVLSQLISADPPRPVHAGPLTDLINALIRREPLHRPTAPQTRAALIDILGRTPGPTVAPVVLEPPKDTEVEPAPNPPTAIEPAPPTAPSPSPPRPPVDPPDSIRDLTRADPISEAELAARSPRARRRKRFILCAIAVAVVLLAAGTVQTIRSTLDQPHDPDASSTSGAPQSGLPVTTQISLAPPADVPIGAALATGTATDPVGDAATNDDLSSIDWAVYSNVVTFDLHYVSVSTVDAGTYRQIDLDTDASPATGCGGFDASYFVRDADDVTSLATGYTACDGNGTPAATDSLAHVTATGVEIVIPRSELSTYGATVGFRVDVDDGPVTALARDFVPDTGELKLQLA